LEEVKIYVFIDETFKAVDETRLIVAVELAWLHLKRSKETGIFNGKDLV
jgi:hypothetical protein